MSKYIIGNLKMNLLNPSECERYFRIFKKEIKGKKFKHLKIILCPPFVYLENFVNNLASKNVRIGVQNVFWEKSNQCTGEISPWMIKNLKVDYTIIGHSERRKYFGETSAMNNLKIAAAIKAGLSVIYCVGETEEERKKELTAHILATQIKEGLKNISSSQLEKIIIAYEPIWSVGTDIVPSSNEIMETKIIIRKILSEIYGLKNGLKTSILYGGSVKHKNVAKLCLSPGVDGALVGRESLMPREFIKIAQIIDQ